MKKSLRVLSLVMLLAILTSSMVIADSAVEINESKVDEIKWELKELAEPKIVSTFSRSEENEPNNTAREAYMSDNRIRPNTFRSGKLSQVDDKVDFYYFEHNEYRVNLNFHVFNVQPLKGMRVDIYNSRMEHIAGSEVTSSLGYMFSSSTLLPDTYYIKISLLDRAFAGSYRIGVDQYK